MRPSVETRKPMRPACRRFASLALCLLICICSESATAQTCAAPLPLVPNMPSSKSTCVGEHIADFFCGDIPNPGRNTVYRFELAIATSVQFFVTGAGIFDPAIYLMDGTHPCDSAPCIGAGDGTSAIENTNLPPGAYWLVVAATPASAGGTCGTFILDNVMAPADEAFADGFD